jgi:nucleoid-associated protein YgaU
MVAALSDRRPTAAYRPIDRSHIKLYRPATAPSRSFDASHRPAPAEAGRHRGEAAERVEARRARAAVYRRRRLLAGGLLLLVVAAVLIGAQLIQAGIGGGPLTTTGAAAGPGMIQAGATEYIVRPGDTLWTIAAAMAPGRDERPVVDRLVHELGGASIYPGEVIRLQSAA